MMWVEKRKDCATAWNLAQLSVCPRWQWSTLGRFRFLRHTFWSQNKISKENKATIKLTDLRNNSSSFDRRAMKNIGHPTGTPKARTPHASSLETRGPFSPLETATQGRPRRVDYAAQTSRSPVTGWLVHVHCTCTWQCVYGVAMLPRLVTRHGLCANGLFPSVLTLIQSLQQMNLSFNMLSKLPRQLANMENLCTIVCHMNRCAVRTYVHDFSACCLWLL